MDSKNIIEQINDVYKTKISEYMQMYNEVIKFNKDKNVK